MNEREFEQMLRRIMKVDFSVGSEKFRDALLARCLSVLDDDDEMRLIDIDDLDLIAAAGNPTARFLNTFEPDGSVGDNMRGNRLV